MIDFKTVRVTSFDLFYRPTSSKPRDHNLRQLYLLSFAEFWNIADNFDMCDW